MSEKSDNSYKEWLQARIQDGSIYCCPENDITLDLEKHIGRGSKQRPDGGGIEGKGVWRVGVIKIRCVLNAIHIQLRCAVVIAAAYRPSFENSTWFSVP